jgi:DNA primase
MALPSEEIKSKLDIVQVLREYIDLKPAGRNFKANCPFHQEKTASFIVSTEKQIWHCFGCGEGGDVFKFLMKYENIEFSEALVILAEKAGVELRRLSPTDQKQFGILYDINAAAAEAWNNEFENSKRAQEYLKERKLNRETISEFEIGFAANSFDALTVHLISKGFAVNDLVRAGLVFKSENANKYIDRFRGRIMFPIHNHSGKVVGFSGRILPELDNGEIGKYINSPETPIFNKSRLLYGFWKSKNEIRETKTALLVEGQMDFLMLWQAGIKNLVATSGTALTADHLSTLKKVADNIVVTFDKDQAGIMAAERAIDLAGASDLTPFVLDFGNYKDPAEAAEQDPVAVLKAMKTPTPAMEYYFDTYLVGTEGRPPKSVVMTLLSKIKNLWNMIDQANWLRELSHRSSVPIRELSEELERLKDVEISTLKKMEPAVGEPEKDRYSRLDNVTLRMLSLMSIHPGGHNEEAYVDFVPPRYKEAYIALTKGKTSSLENDTRALLDMIELRSSLEADTNEEIIKIELQRIFQELELEYLRGKMREIAAIITKMEEESSPDDMMIKLREFDDVSKKIKIIEDVKKNQG